MECRLSKNHSTHSSAVRLVLYSVVSIKRTGSLNYFEVFSHPVLFFHVLKKIFAPPCSFFHVLKKIFAPPCSLITSCSLNRYYRVNAPRRKFNGNRISSSQIKFKHYTYHAKLSSFLERSQNLDFNFLHISQSRLLFP